MRKNLLFSAVFLLSLWITKAQEYIAVIQSPYVVLLNAETGAIENEQFIDMTPQSPSTAKGIKQIGEEIWITNQASNVIFRYDLEGNFISQVSGNMANIRGLDLIDNSEVWVTNASSSGTTPSNSIVRLDTDGNHLGHFLTNDRSPFDVIDNKNGEVYLSYSSGGSPIERRDYSGEFIDFIVPPNVLNFTQQMWVTQDGKILASTFSNPSGVYIFDIETGDQLFYSQQTGARGVIQTGNGNILWTNSAGIHLIDMDTQTSSLIKSGPAQYFAMINPDTSCFTPSLSIDGPDFVCENSTATLTANTNGDLVRWYDSETSTTPIYTGFEFTTPELTESTSYWIEAINHGEFNEGEIIEGGGRVAPSSFSAYSPVSSNSSPWGLSFTTTEAFTINSVDVFLASNSPGTLVMKLLDENWDTIEEKTIELPAGNSSSPVQYEVPLEFYVEGNKTYRLVASESPAMVRELTTSHPGFPYPIGDVGSITGGTIYHSDTNATVYYFFYNWKVQTGEFETCESERIEFTIEVQETPDAPTGDSEQYFTLGQTLADLIVEGLGDFNWYADENGETPLDENTELVDTTTYYVSQTINGCESELFAITVYLQLSTIDVNTDLFSIYPNPVIDKLHINGKQNIESVEIFDQIGRRIKQVQGLNNNSIDFQDFKPGVYIIRVHTNEKVQNFKVIKK